MQHIKFVVSTIVAHLQVFAGGAALFDGKRMSGDVGAAFLRCALNACSVCKMASEISVLPKPIRTFAIEMLETVLAWVNGES